MSDVQQRITKETEVFQASIKQLQDFVPVGRTRAMLFGRYPATYSVEAHQSTGTNDEQHRYCYKLAGAVQISLYIKSDPSCIEIS